MNKRIRFFQSVKFKIALVFVLLLVISIEIIGAYFIRGLEKATINNFTTNMNQQVESLATNLSGELAGESDSDTDAVLQRMLSNFSSQDVIEARVVDDKGIVRATSAAGMKTAVGKRNEYRDVNDLSFKNGKESKEDGKRVWINVVPIQSPTGDATLGVLYVKSDIESKYQEVSDATLIFFTAALIAGAISLVVALLVARNITKPIEEMQEQALRISQGDYSGTIKVHGTDELGQLAYTFNQLASRIEEAQETTEAERTRLDNVLTHMTDGVVATDRRGNVVIINDMACELLEKSREETMGKSILTLLDIEADYTLRSLLEGQEEIMLDYIGQDETMTILKADFSMIRRESGFISGLVCVLHDVTEQEKVERERREFVSNVSHELRTPLTSMRSYIEALVDGAWQDPEVAPTFLKVTQEETDRMIRMINDLLNLSKIDADGSHLQLELINLNEMFNFVLNRFDMMIKSEGKNYVIRREFTQRPVWVEADADKMMQVLDNILNNAIKYSPKGGEITCRLLETHNNVIISVTDQGLGIPQKDLGRIFDRFYRVDKARSRAMGGTGLGLAISKEVVRQHGGNVWAESVEGTGSTFYISLPYEPYEEDLWE